jgi:DNA-binding response OmpR family regulator
MPERPFPIFVLTARAEDEHRQWSGQLDNLDFMEKPVSIRRMLAMLDSYFAASKTAGERACQ